MTARVVPANGGSGAKMGAQLKRAAKVRQHPDGSDSKPVNTRKGAAVMMMAQPSDHQPEARGVLFDAPSTIPPADRHYYVDDVDAPGYCAACSLPARNGRHTARRAA